ncbi:SDR family oxidoreductase [Hafnia alvei]|uniref:NAD(P)-dependent dehydrogenase, short-chain alcohol dehydrogenase family n=1 Tax=Hafnia alvei TaxID=569 RepID=A0A1C6Z6P9_HAFAL|nr:SDR family oxidoreductase [Hafnia alvei]NLS54834.1 SDR family oxidoreductase [Hafnia alvei]SCM54862.1 NAD(P)-dependent dehydrogenase, short-chain alcohol dehydrogenase family [Hafnia alvei]
MNSSPVALVTGASRGIGRATALLLAKRGYRVCINYSQNHAAAQTLALEIAALGQECLLLCANIEDEMAVCDMFNQIDRHWGRLDALVNNAGILQTQSTIESLTAERINQILRINVTGTFLCCREAVKRMAKRHGGRGGAIVNVSSAAAKSGAPFEYLDYAASKGAMDTLTKGLSVEVAGEGIRVNGVRPGFIYTEMHADGGEANRVDRIKASLPMQRGGQPEEVAAAIVWLLSDEASYSTGSLLDLAGGK